MRVAIIVLGVLLCSAATAEPQPWMKKENPETLHSIVMVDTECPVSQTEVKEIVNGVLIRSRLRTGDLTDADEFGFVVEIGCIKPKTITTTLTYKIDVDFIRWVFNRPFLEALPSYGEFGRGDKADIANGTQATVERLVTDYLQANFDLAPE